MRERSPHELISAYFDGELSVGEHRQVEQLLEGDPAARRFLQHLEMLQQDLGELPARRLPQDFSQRVLKEAERRMLEVPVPPAAAAAPSPAEERKPQMPWLRIGLALVVAASLLLAFVLPARLGNEPADRSPIAARRPRATPSATEPLRDERLGDRQFTEERLGKDGDARAGSGDNDVHFFKQSPSGAFSGGAFSGGAVPESGSRGRREAQAAYALDPNMNFRAPTELAAGKNLSWQQNSFVFDVSSDAAQTRVLEQFEQVLSQQQIAVEDNLALELSNSGANPAAVAAENEVAERPNREQPTRRLAKAAKQPADRVYVVDATHEQLSNTLVGLNRLAIEAETPARLRRLGDDESPAPPAASARYGSIAGGASQSMRGIPAGAAGQVDDASAGTTARRSGRPGEVAKTDAAKSSLWDKEGVANPEQKVANTDRKNVEQQAAEPKPTDPSTTPRQATTKPGLMAAVPEETQRAIFIFRVVTPPASPPPAAEPAEKTNATNEERD